MGLRELAESDLGGILEDGSTGFGWPVTITDPLGNSGVGPFLGFTDDISQIIDPDTGQAVSGRLASVVLRISSLKAAGLSIPEGISDENSKPWIVGFDDINGVPYTFKVSSSNPDRALGVVSLILELYQ
jgi:hypothetical protein